RGNLAHAANTAASVENIAENAAVAETVTSGAAVIAAASGAVAAEATADLTAAVETEAATALVSLPAQRKASQQRSVIRASRFWLAFFFSALLSVSVLSTRAPTE